jgi:hypothetical protein
LPYEVNVTDEFNQWWEGLTVSQQEDIAARVELLEELGPTLGRPLVDRVKGSAFHNMKELRCSSDGALRILFAFDPKREAILLIGGISQTTGTPGTTERSQRLTSCNAVPQGAAQRREQRMTPKKFAELRDALYERSPDSRERVAKDVTRLTEELGLAALRARTKRTQAQIADAIGTTQPGVSRLERQPDVLVSTLRDYVAATGGQLTLLAQYPGFECEIFLPVLDQPPQVLRQPREFRVVWQNVRNRQFVHVGWLEFTGREFTFRYTPDAELDPDFEAFPAFPNLSMTYSSSELLPFFADRLLSAAVPDYDHLLAALGLTREEATPVELLARSWGATTHDTIQVVPEPLEQPDGREALLFLASGVRHVDEVAPEGVASRVAALHKGQALELLDEPNNPNNPRAIVLRADDQPVGWVPDYLLDYVHKQREGGRDVSVVVEHANGSGTPWHLRLLARLEVS